jgi:hypothetical protein
MVGVEKSTETSLEQFRIYYLWLEHETAIFSQDKSSGKRQILITSTFCGVGLRVNPAKSTAIIDQTFVPAATLN